MRRASRKSPAGGLTSWYLGPEIEPILEKREAKEPSEEDIRQGLGDVERMVQAGFVPQALIAAWAVLETAMRRRLQGDG